MRPAATARNRPYRPRAADPQAGFSLLGLSFLIFIASLALALAVPAWQRASRGARALATIADLQQFQRAFQDYAAAQGDWPPASALPGEFPPGMGKALQGTAWTRPAPIGGRYVWLRDTLQRGERLRAAIGIVTTGTAVVSDDPRQLDALRDQVAGGGLDPHRLRFGFRNEPVYVMEH